MSARVLGVDGAILESLGAELVPSGAIDAEVNGGFHILVGCVNPPLRGRDVGALLAFELLDDKLTDVQLSSENAAESNSWEYALLHVVAYDADYADRIEDAWATLPGELKEDTIVVVTVTNGNDDFIY